MNANMDAYQSDLDEILKAVEDLAAFIPTGETKKGQERRKQFEEARGKIRSTVNLMRNDYVPVEVKKGGAA